MTNKQLTEQLLTLVKEQSAQQAKLTEQLVQAQYVQTQLLQSWMNMFKVPDQPQRSSSPEERAETRALNDTAEWEPLTMQDMQELLSLTDAQ
jgi:ABC-type oligopeptide transport system ATPase subunit